MNNLKSWFAVSYWYLALAILALALYQLAEDKPTASEAVGVAKWWACRGGQRAARS